MNDKWKKLGKEESPDGTIISYINPDTMYVIESRKRHIPHANRSGTWEYTSYFVLKNGQELADKHSLKDAKIYAETEYQKEISAADKIKVIIKHPDEPIGHEETIDNTLEALQGIVNGYIETVDLGGRNLLICNEEGKIRSLPPNFTMQMHYRADTICGTVIIAGVHGVDLTDVPMGLNAWKNLLKRWGN